MLSNTYRIPISIYIKSAIVLVCVCLFVCLFVCPELIGKTKSPRKLKICIQG